MGGFAFVNRDDNDDNNKCDDDDDGVGACAILYICVGSGEPSS